MKAITLWQPWASLWCSPVKLHETRGWSTSYRGWLLVHAAKRKLDDFTGDRLDEIMDGHFGQHWGLEIPFGSIVGMVRLIDCVRTETMPSGHADSDDYECGDFHPGRFGWRRGDYRVFVDPIPYKGAQGFFDVPDDVYRGHAIRAYDQHGAMFDPREHPTYAAA